MYGKYNSSFPICWEFQDFVCACTYTRTASPALPTLAVHMVTNQQYTHREILSLTDN